MTSRDRDLKQERAMDAVAQCEIQLRRAEESVRSAGEALRRAIRASANAEAELVTATGRLDRAASPLARAG